MIFPGPNLHICDQFGGRIFPGAEDFVLGWRLPSVVAPPPDGALRLLPVPMRLPCNIAVDPRLCKGSVFANRRKFLEQNKSHGVEESREEHYRYASQSTFPCARTRKILAAHPFEISVRAFPIPRAAEILRVRALLFLGPETV